MNKGIKRFITCHVPVYACNFRCSYCYVGQHQNAYQDGIKQFIFDPEAISRFFSVERLGGFCYFNMCGNGETLLHPQIIELVSFLTKQGHFVDIITNGVLTDKFRKIIETFDEFQKSHLFIKFSYHYLELKKRNLMNTFIDNVNMIKDSEISYTIEITPHDELIPYIDEIKEFSLKNFGALPHITVARNEDTKEIALLSKYSKEEYGKIWSVFDSPLFDFKLKIFGEKRTEFCYAGEYSLYCNLATGDYFQCYCGDWLGNIKNLKKAIHFRAIGKCRLPHCFNGHAFLSFGNIPELKTPTYAEERNRTMGGGIEWLKKNTADFFNTKTSENNENIKQGKQYMMQLLGTLLKNPRRVCKKISDILQGGK